MRGGVLQQSHSQLMGGSLFLLSCKLQRKCAVGKQSRLGRATMSSRAWLSCCRMCREGACAPALPSPSAPLPCASLPPGCPAREAAPKQNRRHSAGLSVPGSSRRSSPPGAVNLTRSQSMGTVTHAPLSRAPTPDNDRALLHARARNAQPWSRHKLRAFLGMLGNSGLPFCYNPSALRVAAHPCRRRRCAAKSARKPASQPVSGTYAVQAGCASSAGTYSVCRARNVAGSTSDVTTSGSCAASSLQAQTAQDMVRVLSLKR